MDDANHNMLVEAALTEPYVSFKQMQLNYLFLTLQGILEELLDRHEENDYDILQMAGEQSITRMRYYHSD